MNKMRILGTALREHWVIVGSVALLGLIQVFALDSSLDRFVPEQEEFAAAPIEHIASLESVRVTNSDAASAHVAHETEDETKRNKRDRKAKPEIHPLIRRVLPWYHLGIRMARRELRAQAAVGVRATNRSIDNDAEKSPNQEIATFEALDYSLGFGDPILGRSGEMTYEHTLVSAAGTGLGFDFTLTYRSGYEYEGPVGENWEHNWNVRIKEEGNGDLTRYAFNRQETYQKVGTAYVSPPGFFEHQVTKSVGSPNKVRRYLQDGGLEVYEEAGRPSHSGWYLLTEVKHRYGANNITLEYDGSDRLTSITDTRGTEFVISYSSGSAYMTKLEEFAPGSTTADRDWILSYSSGRLESIENPAVATNRRKTSFTYSSGGGNIALLESIKDPRANQNSGSAYLTISYDTSNRVESQQYGPTTGHTYTFTYSSNATTEVDREGAKRIVEYNSSGAIEKLILDPAGKNLQTTFDWNSDDLLERITFPEGNGRIYKYDEGRLTADIDSNATGINETSITTMRAGSNHLVTEYFYDEQTTWTMVDRVKLPTGDEWTLTRNSQGDITEYASPEYPLHPTQLVYDSVGRLLTMTDPENRARTFYYDSSGLLTKSVRDPGGLDLTAELELDEFGRITKAIDGEGREVELTLNLLGEATTVTTNSGHDVEMDYDYNGMVTEVRTEHGNADIGSTIHKSTFAYTTLNRVSSAKDYYGSGLGSNRETTYAYDEEDRLTLVTYPRGNKVQAVYEADRSLVISQTVGYGAGEASTVNTYYDDNANVTKVKDGLNNETLFHYDGFDRVTKTVAANSSYVKTTYNKNSQATSNAYHRSDNTQIARFDIEYDDNSRPTKTRQWAKKADLSTNLGSTEWIDSTLYYDKASYLTKAVSPCGCGGGTDKIFGYDAAGRKTSVEDSLTNTVTYFRDDSGLVTKLESEEDDGTTERTYVATYEYDGNAHLTEIAAVGNGSSTALTTTITVDALGRTRSVTNPNSNVDNVYYDALGRVTKQEREMGGADTIEHRIGYDLNNNVISKILELGASDGVTLMAYDAADRLTSTKDEGGTTETYEYDDAHNVVTMVDRNGTVAVMSYDNRNHLTGTSYTLATGIVGSSTEDYWYDQMGRLTKAYNVDGLVVRTFNTLNQLEKETIYHEPGSPTGGGATPYTIEYVYDGSSRVSLIKYPDSYTTLKYHYDDINQITKIQQQKGTGSFTDVATWTMQGPRRPSEMLQGNGVKEVMEFDVYGRLTKMIHDRPNGGGRQNLYMFKRGYDAGSRTTYERRDYWANSGTQLTGQRDYGSAYYYDKADRLTKAKRGVGYHGGGHAHVETAAESNLDYVTKVAFEFDDASNRQTMHFHESSGSAESQIRREDHSFDLENQHGTRKVFEDDGTGTLTQTGSTRTFVHDANGSLTGGNYIVTTYKRDVHNRIREANSWVYKYGPFGRRLVKRDTGSNEYRFFLYEGVRCILEYAVCPDDGKVDECRGTDPIWTRIYGHVLVDQILWGEYDVDADTATANDEFYFHLDYQGTVVAITDDPSSGDPQIKEQYRYDEYGEPYFYNGAGTSIGISSYEQDYLYTGRRWEPEYEHYYYRARTMDPVIGTFLSRDPIWHWGTNYGYVGGSPTDALDPMGLQSMTKALIIGEGGVHRDGTRNSTTYTPNSPEMAPGPGPRSKGAWNIESPVVREEEEDCWWKAILQGVVDVAVDTLNAAGNPGQAATDAVVGAAGAAAAVSDHIVHLSNSYLGTDVNDHGHVERLAALMEWWKDSSASDKCQKGAYILTPFVTGVLVKKIGGGITPSSKKPNNVTPASGDLDIPDGAQGGVTPNNGVGAGNPGGLAGSAVAGGRAGSRATTGSSGCGMRTYHRRESTTQTPDIARMMEESGELWGKGNRMSGGGRGSPTASAYEGPLPDGARGVEFQTDVPPRDGTPPGIAEWLGGMPGVSAVQGDYVRIPIRVTKNTQN